MPVVSAAHQFGLDLARGDQGGCRLSCVQLRDRQVEAEIAYRLGIIGAPARIAQAGTPLAFSLLIDVMGSRILIVSSALSLSALLALCLLRASRRSR